MRTKVIGVLLVLVSGGVLTLSYVDSSVLGYILLDSRDLARVRGGHTCYRNIQGGECGSHPSTCDAGMSEPCEKVTVEGEDGEDEDQYQCKNKGETKYVEGSGEDFYPQTEEIDPNESGSGYLTRSDPYDFICHRIETCVTECDGEADLAHCVGENQRDSDDQHTVRKVTGEQNCEHPHEDL